MSIKRTITNGKLDTVTECIGGPEDGTLVSNQMESARFVRIKPQSCSYFDISPLDEALSVNPFYEIVEYVRVSQEKMILR